MRLLTILLLGIFSGAALAGQHASATPASVSDDQNPAARDRVLVVGATRNTGYETVRLLVARGTPVAALARSTSDVSALDALGVPVFRGDALNAADMQAAIAQGPFLAVVTTLGCNRCDNPPDFVGNRNLFDAMQGSATRRVVMISTVGAGDSKPALPWFVRWILREPIALKQQAEEYLRATELHYTIIRPGNLDSDEASGKGVLIEDPTRGGSISRVDLASLIVQAIDDDATVGQTYTAIAAE